MDFQPTSAAVPSLSLVIHSATADVPASKALVAALGQLSLASTWVVDQPREAKVLAKLGTSCELAAAVSARSPQRLRSELSELQTGLQAISGEEVVVVAGDTEQLKSRAAILADFGISAVVPQLSVEGKSPRQLPCGLWQLDPTVALPRARSRWSVLPVRRPSLGQLLEAGNSSLAAIDLSQATARDVQSFSKLLEEVAAASRQHQVQVVTVGQQAAALASRYEVKPQRSILRRAA